MGFCETGGPDKLAETHAAMDAWGGEETLLRAILGYKFHVVSGSDSLRVAPGGRGIPRSAELRSPSRSPFGHAKRAL